MKKRNTYLSTIVPNITSHQPFKSNFSAGRVGAYCIRPTKRPANGVGVDDRRARGVFNTPLHGCLSDNRLEMEKKDTYSSALVPNVTSHQPIKSDFSAGRVGTYCIRPTKCPARGEWVDNKRARVVFNMPLHGHLSDNQLDMEE